MILPSKDRPEWLMLIRGEISHTFQNYALQMKISHLAFGIKTGKINDIQAVEELHTLCQKYSLAVANDLQKIFKQQ